MSFQWTGELAFAFTMLVTIFMFFVMLYMHKQDQKKERKP